MLSAECAEREGDKVWGGRREEDFFGLIIYT